MRSRERQPGTRISSRRVGVRGFRSLLLLKGRGDGHDVMKLKPCRQHDWTVYRLEWHSLPIYLAISFGGLCCVCRRS